MTKENNFRTNLAVISPWNQGVPKINGPYIFGVGVNSTFFLPISATGERPIKYSAEGLPEGLNIDANRGIITGSVKQQLKIDVNIKVTNKYGSDEKTIKIVSGERLALTPPMGWNSWNCWGPKVDTQKIKACADAIVSSGIATHGYNYVNIDVGWQGERGGAFNAIQGNGKFPNMSSLCDYVHDKGLRIGIYSTPWVRSYSGFTGGSSGKSIGYVSPNNKEKGHYIGNITYEKEDAKQWAAWGIDYLKYDWNPWDILTVKQMRDALLASGRDIIYSLSNSAPFQNAASWAELANCWRTTGDITDTWESVSNIGFSQDRWTLYGGPGHWNDPDMLVVGKLGWGEVRENRLTHDEQITHITLWSILAAPLLIGCDLTQLDDFTLRLLCNEEVISVNQDPLGKQGHCLREVRRVGNQGQITYHETIYIKELYDGTKAVALFNRGPKPELLEVRWSELRIEGSKQVRDLWANKNLGIFANKFSIGVPPHGAQLVKIDR